MRTFAIKDEDLTSTTTLGYLIYYETAKAFYIELPDDADPWETPLLLSAFVKRGEHSVNSYWSHLWVQQRIIPQDRQNLGQVLKSNGLEEYDEFKLLLLSMGRCAQDNCYLVEVAPDELPRELTERWNNKIEDVVPLENGCLLCFFRNGAVKKCDVHTFVDTIPGLLPILAHTRLFQQVNVQPDGYGVMWNEQTMIADHALFAQGVDIPLSLQDFIGFVQNRVINATQACQILDCSRQNIDDLIKRDKLHPIRTDDKHKLFLKNEVYQRKRN
jgi:hypothetical protein